MKNIEYDILGLNKPELKILEHLPNEEGATLAVLSFKSKISRTTLKHSLENLKSRGLVRYKRRGKRKFWLLEEKNTLEEKISKLSTKLGLVNNEIIKHKPAEDAEVIIHRGRKNLVKIFERFSNMNKESRLLGIQPNKSYKEYFGKVSVEDALRINHAIRDNKIIVSAVLQENFFEVVRQVVKDNPKLQLENTNSFEGRSADTSVVSSELMDRNSEIMIFEDRIVLNNWEKEFSVEIKDKEMLGLFKDIFNLAKESARKVDQGAIYRGMVENMKIEDK